LVFIGGGIGATLRYLITVLSCKYLGTAYPYGTFFINIIGCLFLGFIVALAIDKSHAFEPHLKLFLVVGIAGGFTTFSAFSYESLELIRNGRILTSLFYLSSSVIFGLMAVYLGFYLSKYIN